MNTADGGIRWREWEDAPLLSHFDQSCCSCGFPGPLRLRGGMTHVPGRAVRKLTRRSKITEGTRPAARTVWQSGWWALSHIAFACPRYGEQVVFGYVGDGSMDLEEVEELYRPPKPDQSVTVLPTGDGRGV